MTTIAIWSIKYIIRKADWLVLSPICHLHDTRDQSLQGYYVSLLGLSWTSDPGYLHEDYHNRISLGMTKIGWQLNGFLQALDIPPYLIAILFYEVSLPGFQAYSYEA